MARLFDIDRATSKLSDVQVKVGQKTFYCHKLVLQLGSDYFADLKTLSSGTVTLQNIGKEEFNEVLRFMYTGEVQLSKDNIESVLRAAETLRMDDLKNVCFRYLNDKMSSVDVLLCWKLGTKYNQTELAAKCQASVVSDVKKLGGATSQMNVSEKMMISILSDNNLNVKSEVEVCELLMSWIDAQTDTGNEINLQKLLSLIRWSDISMHYIKSKLLQSLRLT